MSIVRRLKERVNRSRRTLTEAISENIFYIGLFGDEHFINEQERDRFIELLQTVMSEKSPGIGFQLGERKSRTLSKSRLPIRRDYLHQRSLEDVWTKVEEKGSIKPILFRRVIHKKYILEAFFKATSKMSLGEIIAYCHINDLNICLKTYLENIESFKQRGVSASDLIYNDLLTNIYVNANDLPYIYESFYKNGLEALLSPVIINYEEIDEARNELKDLYRKNKISKREYVDFINANPSKNALQEEPHLIYNFSLTAERSFSFEEINRMLQNLSCKMWRREHEDRLSHHHLSAIHLDNGRLDGRQIKTISELVKVYRTTGEPKEVKDLCLFFKKTFPFDNTLVSKENNKRIPMLSLDGQVRLKPGPDRTFILSDSKLYPDTNYYHDVDIEYLNLLFDERISSIEDNVLVSLLLSNEKSEDIFNHLMSFGGLTKSNLEIIKIFKGFNRTQKETLENKIKLENIFR